MTNETIDCACGSPDGPECSDCKTYRLEKRAERLAARIRNAGIPTGLNSLTLAQLEPNPVKDAVTEWLEGDLAGVCLSGPVGTGKTYAAAVGACEYLKYGKVRWVSAARLMAQLRSGYETEARDAATRILTERTGALILDDLDKVNPTEFGRETMFLMIDAMVSDERPLFVTTNESLSGLGAKLGDAVKSRIAGYCRTILMQGKDRRLDGGAKT